MGGMGSILLKSFLVIAALYAVIVAGAVVIQRKLMYFPARDRVSPLAAGLSHVVEREIATADGHRVLAWWGKAAPGQPTLLYFHGNAGSLATRAERIRKYMEFGRGVFMMTYRGYGGSSGVPSERANVADALAAYDELVGLGVAPRDIVVYGESLGSGVAVQVAAQRPVGGVILDAPYTSVVDLAAMIYPFLPVRWLLVDRYETTKHLAKVDAPLLVVHGARDTVIPAQMGRAVHAQAREPKELVLLANAGHSDHYLHGSFDAINAWIDRTRAGVPEVRRGEAARGR
jgi:fermentation-respiration switch protein FrsA (DUF1100 family)